MMNMILSVIVCFAMIFSGTGSLPATPETSTTLTIRNITIDNGEESVTLAPEARITTAIGSQEAALHFEIGSGEQVLMPASGKISAEGIQFELGGSGRSYSISADTLTEMADMGPEDIQMLDVFADFIQNYGALLGKAIGDTQFNLQFSEIAMKALLETNGTATETEIEIDGETYPAQEIQLQLTAQSMMEMMDKLSSCGIPEVEAMFDSCLELVSIAEGAEVSSFADMVTGLEEDVSIPMNLVLAEQDDFAYEAASMEMTEEASGMTINVVSEAITRGEETNMTMSMGMGDDSNAMVYEVEGTLIGPMEAPTAMNLECGMYVGTEYGYPAENEGEEDYISNSETSMYIAIESETENGLEEMKLSATMESYSESGNESDPDTFEQSFRMDASCIETLEADGSVTAAWELGTDIGGQDWTLSFDLNKSKGDAVDYFANATDYALTAETLNGNGEEMGEEMTMLSMDAMGYVAGAYALTTDESVMDLVNMFSAIAEDYLVETEAHVEEVEPDKEYSDEYVDYAEEEYQEPVSVGSFDEAAAIFDGKIPDFTAPEGYEISDINVDEYNLNAFYINGEKSFDLSIFGQYGSEDSNYSLLANGELTPLDGYIVETYEYDGSIGSATIYNMDEISMYFYFNGLENSEVEAILAGLK